MSSELPPYAKWVEKINPIDVQNDFNSLLKELTKNQSEQDVQHLKRIIFFARLSAIVGLATMPMNPMYVFPAIMISFATFVRWTCIGHHVCHGGYNNVVSKNSQFDRFQFALGSIWKRLSDWPDWMDVASWNYEHNHLHHYQLNEDTDPDLVEQNLTFVREANIPIVFKYMFVTFFMLTWKWFYYASNTFANLKAHENKVGSFAPLTTLYDIVFGNVPKYVSKLEFILRVISPYFIYQFIILPLPLFCIGLILQYNVIHVVDQNELWAEWFFTAHKNATINLLLGDVITNIHSFICIVTNHAGEDMYRWRTHAKPLSGAFYIRAIVSSANYSAGNDYIDVLHGWLNYQAEHHCFPSKYKLIYMSYDISYII